MSKALNSVKYFGKNFWKVLPIASAINYHNKHPEISESKEFDMKAMLHSLHATITPIFLTLYLSVGFTYGVWTPKKYQQLNSQLREFYKANNTSNPEKIFCFQEK